jgi:ATP-dependent Clp protease ATP-binding subunit ClpA
MLERFTKRARLVVQAAHEHGRAVEAQEVRPEHLLLGVLDDPDCLAVRVLSGLGVEREALRLQVLEAADPRRGPVVDAEDAAALDAVGIDVEEVLRRFEERSGTAVRGASARRHGGGRLRWSKDAKKVLELSLREAIALTHDYIGTEHLLLALVRTGTPSLQAALAARGLEHSAVRAAVVEALRRAG